MESKIGINETLEVAVFLGELGNSILAALKDGKVNFWDAGEFLDDFPEGRAAFNGILQVPAEVDNLDNSETAMIRAAFIERMKLSGNPRAVQIADAAMEAAVCTARLVTAIRGERTAV